MNRPPLKTGQLHLPGYASSLPIQSISRLEGTGNYTIIHLTTSSRPLLVSQTLRCFELCLPAFIRISKTWLVNPFEVEKLVKRNSQKMYVQFSESVKLSVARRRIRAVTDRFATTPGCGAGQLPGVED